MLPNWKSRVRPGSRRHQVHKLEVFHRNDGNMGPAIAIHRFKTIAYMALTCWSKSARSKVSNALFLMLIQRSQLSWRLPLFLTAHIILWSSSLFAVQPFDEQFEFFIMRWGNSNIDDKWLLCQSCERASLRQHVENYRPTDEYCSLFNVWQNLRPLHQQGRWNTNVCAQGIVLNRPDESLFAMLRVHTDSLTDSSP